MGRAKREHRQRVAAGLEKPFRQSQPVREQWLNCGKCNTTVPISRLNDHLKECCPEGIRCHKCEQLIKENWAEHYESCNVLPKRKIEAVLPR